MCCDCMVEAKKCLPDVDGGARWLERHDISGSEIYHIPSARSEYWNTLNGTCEWILAVPNRAKAPPLDKLYSVLWSAVSFLPTWFILCLYHIFCWLFYYAGVWITPVARWSSSKYGKTDEKTCTYIVHQ